MQIKNPRYRRYASGEDTRKTICLEIQKKNHSFSKRFLIQTVPILIASAQSLIDSVHRCVASQSPKTINTIIDFEVNSANNWSLVENVPLNRFYSVGEEVYCVEPRIVGEKSSIKRQKAVLSQLHIFKCW